MADQSNSVPLFRQSAEDLVKKLSEIGTAEAMGLLREARELVDTFRAWESTGRPPNDVRIAKIQQLFALNRRVLDFLAQRAKGKK
ncbi:MAG: hypothetical protein QM820_54950 [Minicystis sp.]